MLQIKFSFNDICYMYISFIDYILIYCQINVVENTIIIIDGYDSVLCSSCRSCSNIRPGDPLCSAAGQEEEGERAGGVESKDKKNKKQCEN